MITSIQHSRGYDGISGRMWGPAAEEAHARITTGSIDESVAGASRCQQSSAARTQAVPHIAILSTQAMPHITILDYGHCAVAIVQ